MSTKCERRSLAAFTLMLATGNALAEENASNPLAAANNVDLRWQYTSADASDTDDIYIDGAYMATKRLMLNYELHCELTDVTG